MAQTRIPFEIEMADGQEFDVVADLRDMRNWERNNGGKPFATGDIPLERLSYVAWSALRRQGKYKASFKIFDSECVSLESVDADDEQGLYGVNDDDDDDSDDEEPDDLTGPEDYEPGAIRPTAPAHGAGNWSRSESLPG